ncbi:MAG: 4-oxalomesaconate tautomerase [Hyphomicrobiales bacterium]
MQTAIPCTLMRGGTSKGPFFLAKHLPEAIALRDRVLLAAMGSPDTRQIDGLGGADPLTSKVGIVSRSQRQGVDIDFLFAQVSLDKPLVDTTPNCGNMLAAALPFAIEQGLLPVGGAKTTAKVLTVNTGMIAAITVETPGGAVAYEGDCVIDGVPGSHAPIAIDFLDIAGSVCTSLLPTGHVLDVIDGIEATCIDNGMPVVVLAAESFGRTGYETRDELNRDADFKTRLEAVRLKAGLLMGLGDVSAKVVPKMTLVAPPRHGGAITTRTFIPHICHASIGVLGAVSVATACVLPGSMPHAMARLPQARPMRVSIEHPTGEFTAELAIRMGADGPVVERAALLRTARRLFAGEVFVPRSIWDGRAVSVVG